MNHSVLRAIRELSVHVVKNDVTGKEFTVATRPLAWRTDAEDLVLNTVWPLIEKLEFCLDNVAGGFVKGGEFDTAVPWLEMYKLFKNNDSCQRHAEAMVKRGTVITEEGFCYYYVYRDEVVGDKVTRTGIWVDDVYESGVGTTVISYKRIVVEAEAPVSVEFSPVAIHPGNFPDILECNVPGYDIANIPARAIISLKGIRPVERVSLRIGEMDKGRLNHIYGFVELSKLPMWLQQAIFSGETVVLRAFETSTGNVIIPVQLGNVHIWDRFSNLEL